MKEQSIGGKLLKGTIVIIFVSVLAKITTFITEAILASYLGTTYQSDAYYMVTSIQYVIYPMLSVGIWKVFLPIYKEKITLGDLDAANGLANKVITNFTIVSVILVAIMMIFSNVVVTIVAPGFQGETKELCVKLVRISAPMYIFIMAAAVYASMLQCHNRFLGSQIREVASHIPTIIAAILLFPRFGIMSLGYALIAGGLLRLLIELPFVNWGYRFRPSFKKKSPEYSLMMKRLPSALISEGVNQLNMLVDKMMASTLPEGAVSGLNYGHRLTNVLSGLLSQAIATALYPQVVELISLNKHEELSRLMSKILKIIGMVLFPITIACILFRTELVSAVFERGSFNAESVALTSGTFACYSAGLFFVACNTIITNVFYGFGDTKTPMFIGIANLVINVGLNLLLVHYIGINGLAIATSLSACIVFFVRAKLVGKYVKMHWGDILKQFAKVLLASAVACGLAWLAVHFIHVNKYLTIVIAAAVGVAVYLGELYVLKIEELHFVIGLIRKKFLKK